jgi:Flp pilus assembly protein TadG
MGTRKPRQDRSGSIAVLALCLMIVMLGVIALAVDIGYMAYVDTELQRTADSAAIAAAWKLVELRNSTAPLDSCAVSAVRGAADRYAQLNRVANATVSLATEDTTVGELPYPFSAGSAMTFADPGRFNAVTVRVRKTSSQNGAVALFFARALGFNTRDSERVATAAFIDDFGGFRIPVNQQNLDLLPIALDKTTWDALLAGSGRDDYTWDDHDKCVRSGSDGIREASLYPEGTGAPGNRGTVDIGSSNNSTCDISRQIRDGVSPSDLAHHGGQLALDENGRLYLNGDTGISAGVKDDLASIIGKPRIIPIFSQVAGPGNNAQYTIIGFGGIRIMNVKLTGSPSSKKVVIQVAPVVSRGAIASSTGSSTSFVYSPVWLVH